MCITISAMRHVVGGRAIDHTAASTSQVGRFETEILTLSDNRTALMNLSGAWIDRLRQRMPMKKIVLDMDSSVSESYGRQEGTAYNGHFGCTCYHPLFCFNHFGDLEGVLLREGNAHNAKDWKIVLDPIVARYRKQDLRRYFRGDAAFANPRIYEYLEAEHFRYAIRLSANDILQGKIEHLMTRPVGRPPKAPIVLYHEFQYQCVQLGELFPPDCAAEVPAALDDDDVTGESDQHRRESYLPCSVSHFPDGRSRRVAGVVRGYPRADRPAESSC
jgi:Transposase DDE domain group 1